MSDLTLRALAATLLVACLAGSGCSGSRESRGSTVSLSITRDFGAETIAADDSVEIGASHSLLDALRGRYEVERSSLSSVDAIEGLRRRVVAHTPAEEVRRRAQTRHFAGEGRDRSMANWVFLVNGIETDAPPEDFRLFPGDAVQGDLRDWDGATSVRATVGAFPQPFTGGMFGDRFPTTVHCAGSAAGPCRVVEEALRAADVAPDGSAPRARRGLPSDRVHRAEIHVGTWRELRAMPAIRGLVKRAAFARVHPEFTRAADALRVLDWEGRPIRTERAGAGMVAAVRPGETRLVWVVTGVDREGVARAARALDAGRLRDAYAVVVTDRGVEQVPVAPRRFSSSVAGGAR